MLLTWAKFYEAIQLLLQSIKCLYFEGILKILNISLGLSTHLCSDLLTSFLSGVGNNDFKMSRKKYLPTLFFFF